MADSALRHRLKTALRGTNYADELLALIGVGNPFSKVYYVDATNGNDSWGGLSPDRAFLTLQAALDATTTNNHDAIVLSANAAHVLTDELVISKNRVHIFGTGFREGAPMGQRSRITMGATTGTAIAAINITGVGVTLNNLKITSSDTLSTSVYGVADGGEFTILRNCWIEKNTDLDQTGAAELLCNSDTGAYIGCTIGNMIYQPSVARQNVLFTRETITGKVARDVYFEECNFLSFATSTTFVNCRATTNDIERMALFRRCHFESKQGSSLQDEAFGIASALTDANVSLQDCSVVNITNIATASSNVFSNKANSASLGGKATECT